MKLYNPFKWHVIEYHHQFILRKFSFAYLKWVYHSYTDYMTMSIEIGKKFSSLAKIAEYLDRGQFESKKTKPTVICSLDKL